MQDRRSLTITSKWFKLCIDLYTLVDHLLYSVAYVVQTLTLAKSPNRFRNKTDHRKNRLTCIHSTVNEILIVIVLFVYHFIQRTDWSRNIANGNEKSAQRDANTAHAGCSMVRTPPARPPIANTQTHRQDPLQYTAPQLASAQCNNLSPCAPYIKGTWQLHKPIHLSKL